MNDINKFKTVRDALVQLSDYYVYLEAHTELAQIEEHCDQLESELAELRGSLPKDAA